MDGERKRKERGANVCVNNGQIRLQMPPCKPPGPIDEQKNTREN